MSDAELAELADEAGREVDALRVDVHTGRRPRAARCARRLLWLVVRLVRSLRK